MRFVNDFTDYEMIDTSGGEKLERWGSHVLVRPDPQIIWNTKKNIRFGSVPMRAIIGRIKAADSGSFSKHFPKAGRCRIVRSTSVFARPDLSTQDFSRSRRSTGRF